MGRLFAPPPQLRALTRLPLQFTPPMKSEKRVFPSRSRLKLSAKLRPRKTRGANRQPCKEEKEFTALFRSVMMKGHEVAECAAAALWIVDYDKKAGGGRGGGSCLLTIDTTTTITFASTRLTFFYRSPTNEKHAFTSSFKP